MPTLGRRNGPIYSTYSVNGDRFIAIVEQTDPHMFINISCISRSKLHEMCAGIIVSSSSVNRKPIRYGVNDYTPCYKNTSMENAQN